MQSQFRIQAENALMLGSAAVLAHSLFQRTRNWMRERQAKALRESFTEAAQSIKAAVAPDRHSGELTVTFFGTPDSLKAKGFAQLLRRRGIPDDHVKLNDWQLEGITTFRLVEQPDMSTAAVVDRRNEAAMMQRLGRERTRVQQTTPVRRKRRVIGTYAS